MKPIVDVALNFRREDYEEALKFGYLERQTWKLPIFALLVTFVVHRFFKLELGGKTWVYVPVFLLAYISSYGLILLKVKSRVDKKLKTDVGNLLQTETFLKFYDDYIKVETKEPESSNKLKYDVFYKVYNWKNIFILYTNVSQSLVISKRDLTGEEIKKLEVLFEEKLGVNYIAK